MMATMMTV